MPNSRLKKHKNSTKIQYHQHVTLILAKELPDSGTEIIDRHIHSKILLLASTTARVLQMFLTTLFQGCPKPSPAARCSLWQPLPPAPWVSPVIVWSQGESALLSLCMKVVENWFENNLFSLLEFMKGFELIHSYKFSLIYLCIFF